MDPATSYAQKETKFIQQDPISSNYSDRISEDDKARFVPLLIRLHGEGASRATMLAECNATPGTTISPAQVDGLRKKLGLRTYRRRLPGSPIQPTHSQSMTNVAPSGRVYEDEDVEHVTASFELQYPQNDTTTVYFHKPFQSVVLRTLGEDHLADQHGRLLIGNVAEVADTSVSDVDLEYTTPQLSIAGNSTTADTSDSAFDETPKVSPILSWDQAGEVLSYSNSHLAKPLKLDESAITAQARLEMKFKPGGFAISGYSDIVYRASLPVVQFYLQHLDGGTNTPRIARLLHVAALLHTLKAFDEAFDLFFILYQHLIERYQMPDPPHALQIFAAISCSRTAQGKLRFQVARRMIRRVRPLVLPLPLMHMRVVNCLKKLEQCLACIVQGLYEHLPAEDSIDAALWTLAPLALHNMKPHIGSWPSKKTTVEAISSAVNDTLQSLQVRDRPPLAFLHGLEFVFARDRDYAKSLDSLALETRLSGSSGVSASISAQSVAYTVLKTYSNRSTPATAGFEESQTCDFEKSLKILAVATIPFAMVDWIGQVGHMFDISYAVEQLRQVSDTDPFTLAPLIDLCFRQMSAPTAKWSSATCGVSAEELLEDCDTIAGGRSIILDPIQRLHRGRAESPVEARNKFQPQHQSVQLAVLPPTLAESLRASNSPSLKSFLSVAGRANQAVSRLSGGRGSRISDARTSRSSWKLSFMSTATSISMSSRQSVQTISSDVEMSG